MHEAIIAGSVDGVVIKGSRVSCIYHENIDKHISIPVDKAVIGDDAIMIKDMTAMAWVSKDVKILRSLLDVYNKDGRQLGYLHGIEVDEDYFVQWVLTENYKIEMKNIVSFGNVIIADVEEAELEKAEESTCDIEEDSAPKEEAAVSMEIGPEVKWNEENNEAAELNVVRPVHKDEEETIIPGVDPKYTYLCGKKLLEDIDIGELNYEKDTIIDADMIRHAIENNAIVKVIVNAEE